jgi:hypothetical protein
VTNGRRYLDQFIEENRFFDFIIVIEFIQRGPKMGYIDKIGKFREILKENEKKKDSTHCVYLHSTVVRVCMKQVG